VKYNDKRGNPVCVWGASTKVKRMIGTNLPGIPDFDHFYRTHGTLCMENT